MHRNNTYLAASLAVAALLGCEKEAPAEPAEAPAAETATDENAAKAPHDEHAEHAAHAEAAEAPAMPAMPAIPAGAKIQFIAPASGTRVSGPLVDGKVEVDVKMGAVGIEVVPAGEVKEGTGHHHILIDEQPIPAGTVVPKDDTHIHFGGGQTEAKIALTPGSHTLTLQFADGLHRSYGPDLSATTEIEVVEAK